MGSECGESQSQSVSSPRRRFVPRSHTHHQEHHDDFSHSHSSRGLYWYQDHWKALGTIVVRVRVEMVVPLDELVHLHHHHQQRQHDDEEMLRDHDRDGVCDRNEAVTSLRLPCHLHPGDCDGGEWDEFVGRDE